MSVALVVSGALAGIFGFCDHAWQILALRGMVSPVHIGGYVATIALGEIVDDETRGEGKSYVQYLIPETEVSQHSPGLPEPIL
jgi:hypothetical protein